MLPLRNVARVLVFDGHGRMLAAKKKDGQFRLPGGGIDAGETAPEAAIREVKEETGLTLASAVQRGEPVEWNWKPEVAGLDFKWTMRKKAHRGERVHIVSGTSNGEPTTGRYVWCEIKEVLVAPHEPEYEAVTVAIAKVLNAEAHTKSASNIPTPPTDRVTHHDAHGDHYWMQRLTKLKVRRGELNELVDSRNQFNASTPAKDFAWGKSELTKAAGLARIGGLLGKGLKSPKVLAGLGGTAAAAYGAQALPRIWNGTTDMTPRSLIAPHYANAGGVDANMRAAQDYANKHGVAGGQVDYVKALDKPVTVTTGTGTSSGYYPGSNAIVADGKADRDLLYKAGPTSGVTKRRMAVYGYSPFAQPTQNATVRHEMNHALHANAGAKFDESGDAKTMEAIRAYTGENDPLGRPAPGAKYTPYTKIQAEDAQAMSAMQQAHARLTGKRMTSPADMHATATRILGASPVSDLDLANRLHGMDDNERRGWLYLHEVRKNLGERAYKEQLKATATKIPGYASNATGSFSKVAGVGRMLGGARKALSLAGGGKVGGSLLGDMARAAWSPNYKLLGMNQHAADVLKWGGRGGMAGMGTMGAINAYDKFNDADAKVRSAAQDFKQLKGWGDRNLPKLTGGLVKMPDLNTAPIDAAAGNGLSGLEDWYQANKTTMHPDMRRRAEAARRSLAGNVAAGAANWAGNAPPAYEAFSSVTTPVAPLVRAGLRQIPTSDNPLGDAFTAATVAQ